jgi:hypothetical protein
VKCSETIVKWGRVLLAVSVLAFATLVIGSGPEPARLAHAIPVETGNASLVVGGQNTRLCALAVGMMVGGALGMGLNPLGGATAISLGMHLGLAAC